MVQIYHQSLNEFNFTTLFIILVQIQSIMTLKEYSIEYFVKIILSFKNNFENDIKNEIEKI